MAKYRLLRQRLLETGVLQEDDLEVPPPATVEELSRVHDAGYVERVFRGELDRPEVRRMGFPWSEALVERSRRSVGGTLAAARHALSHGVGINLAGGTHHAFADRGEGFCVFNDVAVAARAVQVEAGSRGRSLRVLVVDTDVHQGNGTAAIFAGDDSVFTLSLHGERNYPFVKEASDLDVGLPDGAGDEEYLEALSRALAAVPSDPAPDLVFFVAGADPYGGDRLGRLGLTKAGLARRDCRVLEFCRQGGTALAKPVVVVMAGGYADQVDDIVDIHAHTVETAVEAAAAHGRCGTTAPASG